MTDDEQRDQPDTGAAEGAASSLDDKRFEVKWKMKDEPKPAPPQAEAPPDAGSLQQQLDDERKRVEELRDRLARAQADLVNLRRRTEQERGEMEKFASMVLVAQLLPVLDNFQRALDTIPGNLTMLTWIQGVMLIERHLQAILEQQGLAPIDTVGQQFNPNYHEAIGEKETADAQPGTVLQEYQKGYTMHGRVIRPALVEVARAPAAAGEPSPGEADMKSETAGAEPTDESQAEEIADETETENVGP